MGRLLKKLVKNNPYPEEYYEEYPQEYAPEEPSPRQEYQEQRPIFRGENEEVSGPLGVLEDIKNTPSRKGTFETVVQGIPVDLHSLESYIVKISPYVMKTVLRYRSARLLEEVKNYGKYDRIKMNSKTIILIILAIGMAVLGVMMIIFMPKIMEMFKGGI